MTHTNSRPTGSPIGSQEDAGARQPERSQPMASNMAAATQVPGRITLSLSRLFQLEGEQLPVDLQLLTTSIRARFTFLPQPLDIAVAANSLVIVHPREPENNCQQAARLVERARQRAAEGEQGRAVELCRRALQLQPSLHAGRTTLARALVELGEVDQAKTTLRQLLRADPDDQWALSALATLHGQAGNFQEAERLARLALAAVPGNPCFLQTLATILQQAGRFADAADTFRLVIGAAPEAAPARLGLARSLARLQRHQESLLVMQDFFDRVPVHSPQRVPLVQEARTLCAEVQGVLAKENYDRACELVASLRARVEESGGIPIRISEEDSDLGSPALTEIAWWNRATEHRIKIEKSFPDTLKPHLLAHELMHVRLETQALQAGKALCFVRSRGELEHARSLFAGERYELLRRGGDAVAFDSLVNELVQFYLDALANIPQDMLVEWNIRKDLPTLAPIQFGVFRFVSQRHQRPGAEDPLEMKWIPGGLRRLFRALECARALAADDLFGGTTAYGAGFAGRDGFELGQKLFGRFKARPPALGPDDHYGLVDDFADLLGMRGWYHWEPVHSPPKRAAGSELEGIPSPDELDEIAPEELQTASRRLARMSREEALRMLEEIARIGLGGFDHHSMERKHQLQSLRGERFAGLELLCLVHAGVRKLASMEAPCLQPD